MREVLEHMLPQIQASPILDTLGLEAGKYFIVSVHREENVDSRDNLREVVEALQALHQHYGYPVVVSTHPRTRNRLEKLGLAGEGEQEGGIRFLKPFGFLDYNQLQMQACCAISDSGTISEEASILGFPAVTLRRSIERPEALDTGAIALTGLGKEGLLDGVRIATASREVFSGTEREVPEAYQVRNTSERVVRLITGTAKLANRWRNMDEFSRYDWN